MSSMLACWLQAYKLVKRSWSCNPYMPSPKGVGMVRSRHSSTGDIRLLHMQLLLVQLGVAQTCGICRHVKHHRVYPEVGGKKRPRWWSGFNIYVEYIVYVVSVRGSCTSDVPSEPILSLSQRWSIRAYPSPSIQG